MPGDTWHWLGSAFSSFLVKPKLPLPQPPSNPSAHLLLDPKINVYFSPMMCYSSDAAELNLSTKGNYQY